MAPPDQLGWRPERETHGEVGAARREIDERVVFEDVEPKAGMHPPQLVEQRQQQRRTRIDDRDSKGALDLLPVPRHATFQVLDGRIGLPKALQCLFPGRGEIASPAVTVQQPGIERGLEGVEAPNDGGV